MKARIVLGILVALIAAGTIPQRTFARGSGPSVALTETEVYWLTYLREEEKLARDVYLSMNDIWGAQVFARIALSEQRHMDAIGSLLDKYGLPDPVQNEVGVFTDSEVQALYHELISLGKQSEASAISVGVTIEEKDIADLKAAIDGTVKLDLQRVYTSLLRASQTHLSTFLSHQ